MFNFSTLRWFQSLDGFNWQKVGKLFRNPVNIEHSVEMINFVLEDYSSEAAYGVADLY